MKLRIRYGLIVVFLISMLGYSCNDSERDEDDETVASHDNALAEVLFNDLIRQVHQVAMRDTILNDTGLVQDLDICMDSAVRSSDVAIFPIELVIYYGPENTICTDGRERRGKIRATFSGRYTSSFSKVSIVPVSYFVDDIRVTGTVDIENTGFSDAGNRSYIVEVTDGVLEAQDLNVNWESLTARQWTSGADSDENVVDDVFTITSGSTTGRNTKGNTFTSSIQKSQRFEIGCKWFTRGVLQLEVPNLATRTVNYGNGNCDNALTVTRNATTYNVTVE